MFFILDKPERKERVNNRNNRGWWNGISNTSIGVLITGCMYVTPIEVYILCKVDGLSCCIFEIDLEVITAIKVCIYLRFAVFFGVSPWCSNPTPRNIRMIYFELSTVSKKLGNNSEYSFSGCLRAGKRT